MVCNQVVAVYISGTYTPIMGATVTCSGHAPQTTNEYGLTEFSLDEEATHSFRANVDGYVISNAYTIIGCQDRLTIKLEEEEQIQITVKRPTWVSMILNPEQAEYLTGEELQVRGYLRFETEPYTEGEVWLIDADAGEIISERYPMGVSGFYVLKWTPSTYKPEGYNVTVGCDAFVSTSNPLGAWSLMPNGFTKYINVVGSATAGMAIMLPNADGRLFLNNTVTACNEYGAACAEYRFKITNNGDVATGVWYKVSVVGGETLLDKTIYSLDPGATCAQITNVVCAVGVEGAGNLPIGTHTIRVEAGMAGSTTATDTYTEDIYVTEEPTEGMYIMLPNANGKLFLNNTIIACDDPAKGCTFFKFLIMNTGDVTAGAWYTVTIVGEAGPIYTGTVPVLEPQVGSVPINDWICATIGRLSVGTHSIKVEVGIEGLTTATDTYTEDILVIEEAALSVTTHQPFLTIWEEGAKVKGSVANTNGLLTDIGFEYGEATTYGNTTWAGETATPIDFFKDLLELTPGTLYHFRAIATNDVESAYGVDKSFTTIGLETGTVFEILLPNTTLLEQDEVMACDDVKLACTRFNFQIENKWYTGLNAWYTVSIEGGGTLYSKDIVVPAYDTSPTITNYVCALPGPGSLPVGEHKILVEVGQAGQARDTYASETLTVLEYGTPTVDTVGVENPTFKSATLVGTLKDVGLLTGVGFEYGLRYGSTKTEWLLDDIIGGTFKLDLSDLEGNETYRFRAVGRIGDKTGFGEEKPFETIPAVITPISMGWNLEDAKIDEYNVHLSVSNLSEAKRYRILLYGGRGYEFARVDPVTELKEVEIKANIPLERFEEYGYEVHCGIYDLDTSEWLLTEGYSISPISVSVNMGATIAAGGIPDEMETRTDTTFTFIVDNNSTADLNVDVFLSFKGVDSPQEYPHDLVGLQPSEYVYILPGSDITVLNDGYIAKEVLILNAGESGSYTLKVWLPNEAVPLGQDSASYVINTRVGISGM